MEPEDLHLVRVNPITGHRHTVDFFGCLGEAVFAFTPSAVPGDGWIATLANTHLESEEVLAWLDEPSFVQLQAPTLASLKAAVVGFVDTEAFACSLHRWLTLPVAPDRPILPWRMVWANRSTLHVIANDPAPWVFPDPDAGRWPDGTCCVTGTPIIATAEQIAHGPRAVWQISAHGEECLLVNTRLEALKALQAAAQAA
ncbi:hypothetical protein ACWDTQ_22965 [Streptomyces cellulosae]|uniref:Glyoxalase-like domain-containing protein n=1 Tax=Streptomyces cellulosae TaxID=1968 RepID=A0ABW6JLS0_STRCE